jgi:PTH1 family peptidyl-tRNA hydrolase
MVVDAIARRHRLAWTSAPSQVPDSLVTKRHVGPVGETGAAVPVLLAKPLTFMNRSGDAVAAILRYYDVEPPDTLVVVDEVALPFGRLRARERGSAGGHNGLKSIAERLGSTEFPRLRLGVGRGDARRDLADHVLSRFEAGEEAGLDAFIARAADAAELFAAEGISMVMNRYNPDAADPVTD